MTAKICNRFSILSKIWIYELEILMLSFKKILLPLRWYDLRTAPFFIMDTVLGYRKERMILKSFMKFLRFFSSFQIGGGGGTGGGYS